ncbi:MAG: hypothetical protein H6735_34005 [Alphaproteobacteria bacterium]|nr:hypothetical protein [Alphaproteobacteria bacterium]
MNGWSMKSLVVGIAAGLIVGVGIGWGGASLTSTPQVSVVEVAPGTPQVGARAAGSPRAARANRAALRRDDAAGGTVGGGAAISDEQREQIRAEVMAEQESRRSARREEFHARQLDELTSFADEHALDDATFDALQGAMNAFHDRMASLRPPTEGGPPSEEDRTKMHDSFAELEADVRDVLGDELADDFLQRVGPRGPGGPGGPRPPSP